MRTYRLLLLTLVPRLTTKTKRSLINSHVQLDKKQSVVPVICSQKLPQLHLFSAAYGPTFPFRFNNSPNAAAAALLLLLLAQFFTTRVLAHKFKFYREILVKASPRSWVFFVLGRKMSHISTVNKNKKQWHTIYFLILWTEMVGKKIQ